MLFFSKNICHFRQNKLFLPMINVNKTDVMAKKQHFLLLVSFTLLTLSANAQEERSFLDPMFDEKPSTTAYTMEQQPALVPDMSLTASEDSLHLPIVNMSGQVVPAVSMPYSWLGWNTWNIHSGLNVNLSASVFAETGRHRRSGAGFSQSVAALYAMPLSNKLSVAIGGYINRLSWGSDSYVEGGLTGMLSYRFNEKWEAYVYAQKSLTNNRYMPRYSYAWGYNGFGRWGSGMYDWRTAGDRIGAGVRYTPNESFSLEINVEVQDNPNYSRYGYYPCYPLLPVE